MDFSCSSAKMNRKNTPNVHALTKVFFNKNVVFYTSCDDLRNGGDSMIFDRELALVSSQFCRQVQEEGSQSDTAGQRESFKTKWKDVKWKNANGNATKCNSWSARPCCEVFVLWSHLCCRTRRRKCEQALEDRQKESEMAFRRAERQQKVNFLSWQRRAWFKPFQNTSKGYRCSERKTAFSAYGLKFYLSYQNAWGIMLSLLDFSFWFTFAFARSLQNFWVQCYHEVRPEDIFVVDVTRKIPLHMTHICHWPCRKYSNSGREGSSFFFSNPVNCKNWRIWWTIGDKSRCSNLMCYEKVCWVLYLRQASGFTYFLHCRIGALS